MNLRHEITEKLKDYIGLYFQFASDEWQEINEPANLTEAKLHALNLLTGASQIYMEFTHLFKNYDEPGKSMERTYSVTGDQSQCRFIVGNQSEFEYKQNVFYRNCIDQSPGGELIRRRIKLTSYGLNSKEKIDDGERTLDEFANSIIDIGEEVAAGQAVIPAEVSTFDLRVVSTKSTKNNKTTRKTEMTVEDRLNALLIKKPVFADSSAEVLAGELKCSKQAILKTTAWKAIMQRRQGAKNDQVKQHRADLSDDESID